MLYIVGLLFLPLISCHPSVTARLDCPPIGAPICAATEIECPPTTPLPGTCPTIALCVPRLDTTPATAGTPVCDSFAQCPVVCKANQKLCPGQTDTATGCKAKDICVATDVTCQGDTATKPTCPPLGAPNCAATEIACPPTATLPGTCPAIATCVPRLDTTPATAATPVCDSLAQCPVVCMPNQKLCPGQTNTATGCKTRDICVATDVTCPGDTATKPTCPPIGAPNCAATEITCPPTATLPGTCPVIPLCVPRLDTTPATATTAVCDSLAQCPVVCMPNQKKCPGQHDTATGCKAKDICVATDVTCPGDTAGLTCPPLGAPNCAETEIACPPPATLPGTCPTMPMCVPKLVTTPAATASVCDPLAQCPVTCLPTQKFCLGQTDTATGCKARDLCFPIGTPCPGDTATTSTASMK